MNKPAVRGGPVETTLGEVPLRGRLTAGDRPVLFGISGFMPYEDTLGWMTELPGIDALVVNLPGFYSPMLRGVEPGPETTAQAFAEVLKTVAPGRRVVPVGVSTGAAVALLMQPLLGFQTAVLVEPFFHPTNLWALREMFHAIIEPDNEPLKRMANGYLGLYAATRDYSALIEFAPPQTYVVVGGIPLEPRRPMTKLPSLTIDAEREAWRARGAEVIVAPDVGHNVPADARPLLADVIRRALASAPVVRQTRR